MQMSPTENENEHSSIAGMGIWCCYSDQISNHDWNTGPDDEKCASLQLVRPIDLSDKRDGAEDVNGYGHAVDPNGSVSDPNQLISRKLHAATHPMPAMMVGRKTLNPLIATDEVRKAMPRR